MLAKTITAPKKVRRSRVEAELTRRADTKDCVGFTLNKDMSDSEIHNTLLNKLCSVRKELGLA
jgi:hypothetical protein